MNFQGEIAVDPRDRGLKIALLKSYLKRIFWILTGTGKTKGKPF
jgi:hypothetical protein